MDLAELGKVLLERRESLGIPRAEIARRIGVTAGYVWMIERAKPRQRGMPSQPSEEVLKRWAKALGWDEPYVKQLLSLAGQIGPESSDSTRSSPLPVAADVLHFPQPRKIEEEVLIQKVRDLLERGATSQDEWEQIVELLRSFLEWLEFRLRGER